MSAVCRDDRLFSTRSRSVSPRAGCLGCWPGTICRPDSDDGSNSRSGRPEAHRLAIMSLDLTAELLAALLPGFAVVHRPEDLWACRNLGQVPILAPRRFLDEVDDRGPDPLAASWDVTSDSIAARIAVLLGARRLILLKSVGLSADIDRGEAARLGLVDAMFPQIASELWRSWNLSVCVAASPWREFLPTIAEVPGPSEPGIRPDGADSAVGWQPRNRYPEWLVKSPEPLSHTGKRAPICHRVRESCPN